MKSKIRILHILHSFSAGGLENGVVNIINGSPDHLEHELCLLTEGKSFLERLQKPIVCHDLHKRPGNDIRALSRLSRLLSCGKFDIVHTRNWAAFDGVLAAWMHPSLRVIHGEHGRDVSDPHGMNRKRNLFRRVAGLRVDRFVAVSSDLYEWLWKTVKIPVNKLTLIHNGVDTEKFAPSPTSGLKADLGIAPDEFVVGTVARLDPVKDHEGMIEAVRILNLSGEKVRLVIVGDGPNRAAIEKVLDGWTAGPIPILTGYRNDTSRLYGAFDIFLLTSHAEGMSNTLLEAMSSGLPVICTPVGANVELVKDGETGSFVAPSSPTDLAKKIERYQQSSELRHRHGDRARRFVVEHFSLARMINRYIELYESKGRCAIS